MGFVSLLQSPHEIKFDKCTKIGKIINNDLLCLKKKTIYSNILETLMWY